MTRELPSSIVIVGAGAIGMEFAYVLSNYGVKVTIIEFLDRALPNEDADVSKEIAKQYKNYGIEILTSTKVETVVDDGSSVTVTYTGKDGQPGQITADKVLMSIGFAPQVAGYGLENTGVALTDRGAIDIDARMRTNVPGIYAIGDVTAKLQLAHVAEAQGVVAAETIGKATDDEQLEAEGKSDQLKASVKEAGEDIKDAASNVADKVKHAFDKH